MSAAYGSLAMPVPVAADDAAAGDPLLDTLVAFFAAALVGACGDAWEAISGSNPIVKRTFTHNPAEEAFRELTTPALFLWRESIGTAVWRAADYRIRPSTLMLRWVPFMANSQERWRVWSPFFNTLPSALDAAVEDGRTPGWTVATDLDSLAATYDPMADTLGSLLYSHVSVWKLQVAPSEARRVTLTIPMEGAAAPRAFPAIDIPIQLEERLFRDLTKYAEIAYSQNQIVAPAEPPDNPSVLVTNTGRFDYDPDP